MSTEIKAEVTFTTRIDKMTDKSATRYSLNTVQIVPNGDDGVLACATDSRGLVVVPCDGQADEKRQVPPAVLPTKLPKRGGLRVTLNGRWETSDGKFCEDEPQPRFPNVPGVMPEIYAPADHRVVTLNIDVLSRMAEAFGTEWLALVLPEESDKAGCVAGAVPVLPICSDYSDTRMMPGMGVIMPITMPRGDVIGEWKSRRAALETAYGDK